MTEIEKITEVMDYIDGLSAVVFDLDDTLYSEKDYVHSGYRVVAGIIPQVIDAEGKLWNAFGSGKPAIDTVLQNEGIYTEDLKDLCLKTYRNHVPNLNLYDGVKCMFNELRDREIDIGIITDGRPEGQWAKIEVLGLRDLVDAIIITDELGGVYYRKPCGKAFNLMRDIIGNGVYTTMCYVGDNIKKDFIAPEKLGMRCIWFKNKDGLYYSS